MARDSVTMRTQRAFLRFSKPLFLCVVTILVFVSLAVWSEISSWQSQISRTNAYLEQTSQAIAQHTDDVIEVVRQPLLSLLLQIQNRNNTVLQNIELVQTMRELVKTSRYLRSLAYLGPDGVLIESNGLFLGWCGFV